MKNNTNQGTNILGLLGILFVGLKLAHIIDWSWWYVTLPFWAGLPIFLAVILWAFYKTYTQKTKFYKEKPKPIEIIFGKKLKESIKQIKK